MHVDTAICHRGTVIEGNINTAVGSKTNLMNQCYFIKQGNTAKKWVRHINFKQILQSKFNRI